MTTLTGQQVDGAAPTGWANLGGVLVTRFATPDFATGLALVDAIGALADEADHHPDVDLRYTHVDVALTSHDAGGLTARDVDLARRVTEAAATQGLSPDDAGVSRVELALDSPDHARVQPFWRSFLAYEPRQGFDDEVRDPAGAQPPVWFQRSGSDEPRQRWHLDVWVPPSQVQPRIDAAVAAGGTVDDSTAPSFWVLTDPEGNRSCLCTWQDRD
ncbi:VOC family protein [Luteimicrobium xylanilyticum]|uniref:Putative pterin-4-alpha-carbinolamine dehydratase n=1 Tax=Luteimicrobium xylanilyticum TaxID=1133546 RepID=A0A5P9QA82_9MICO|nr:4a-hydroxytetrahydrobiopterin dehydratase [Luteimicrobium xylanilyticum]QFU98334.1 4a-hydroxytetrahydrobiopterin dehydratase [Luteimicrobium xylanilyticum]